MKARPPVRIALNVAIDGALAAAAVPLARAIADPSAAWLDPPWLPAAGAAALLLAGLPVRLPWQYWRFAGIDDLVGVVWAAVGGAALLGVAMAWAGISTGSPTFPITYGLTLLALLGAPRVGYRLWRHRKGGASAGNAPQTLSALVVGAAEDIDLFLRALAWDRRQRLQVDGLLAVGLAPDRAAHPRRAVPGIFDDAAAVLDRLTAEGRLPDTLVVATPDLAGQSLTRWWSRRKGMACGSAVHRVRQRWTRPAPRPCARPRTAADGDRGPAEPPAGAAGS